VAREAVGLGVAGKTRGGGVASPRGEPGRDRGSYPVEFGILSEQPKVWSRSPKPGCPSSSVERQEDVSASAGGYLREGL